MIATKKTTPGPDSIEQEQLVLCGCVKLVVISANPFFIWSICVSVKTWTSMDVEGICVVVASKE